MNASAATIPGAHMLSNDKKKKKRQVKLPKTSTKQVHKTKSLTRVVQRCALTKVCIDRIPLQMCCLCVSAHFHHCLFQKEIIIISLHSDRSFFLYSQFASYVQRPQLTSWSPGTFYWYLWKQLLRLNSTACWIKHNLITVTIRVQKDAPSRVLKLAEHAFPSGFFYKVK